MEAENTQIEDSWQPFEENGSNILLGTTMVIGDVDRGKSTFVSWLVSTLSKNCKVGWIDLDIGQSSIGKSTCAALLIIGLPTTLNLCILEQGEAAPEEIKPQKSIFIGTTSPGGNFLSVVIGAVKLQKFALSQECTHIVVDTCGWISGPGAALKYAKISALSPSNIIGIQREDEVGTLLEQYQKEDRFNIHLLKASSAVNVRPKAQRSGRRQKMLREFFTNADTISIDPCKIAIYDERQQANCHHIVGLQDSDENLISLGVIKQISKQKWDIICNCKNPEQISSLTVGTLKLDPNNMFREKK